MAQSAVDGPFKLQIESLEDETRIDLFLSRKTGESRALIKDHIQKGEIRLNGVAVDRPAAKLRRGDVVEGAIRSTLRESTLTPRAGELEIIHEDDDFLAVNKAQGVVVHPAAGHRGDTLAHHLLHYLSENRDFSNLSAIRPGIVHRLDRGTSGVLLVAKNRHAQERLSDIFKNREIEKEYRCLTWGKTKASGEVQTTIGRDRVHRQKMSSRTPKGRAALTRWERIEAFGHFSYLRVLPKTGRTHQIRVHLSESGHPIVGDPMYGRGATARRVAGLTEGARAQIESIDATLLHAYGLKFPHPRTGEMMELTAPLPEVFSQVLQTLRDGDPLL